MIYLLSSESSWSYHSKMSSSCSRFLYSAFFLLLIIFVTSSSAANPHRVLRENPAGNPTASPSPFPSSSVANNSTVSTTVSSSADNETGIGEKAINLIHENMGVIGRAFVVVGIMTCIVVTYIGIRYLRDHQRKSRSKKYGLITLPEDDRIEMTPLDYEDDDDEDMTVFDQTSARKKGENGEASRPLRKSK